MDRWYLKVSGEQGPRVPHKTLASAYTEARRLFEKFGQTRRVYVLEVIGTIEPTVAERKPSGKTPAGGQQTV